MVIQQTALYSIRVGITTALIAPLLYLAIAGSYAVSESSFAIVWALAAMGIGCACAIPACFIFNRVALFLLEKLLTLNQTKFLLSVLSLALCVVALSMVCGWDNFETIYYKLFVTYVVVSIICIWLYRLSPKAQTVQL